MLNISFNRAIRRYIKSLEALKIKNDHKKTINEIYESHETTLLILGCPRTGSTLLSQLINHHPESICASEFQIERYYLRHHNAPKSVKDLIAECIYQNVIGFKKHLKFGDTLNNFQKDWRSFQSIQKSDNIKCIGDKPLSRFTEAYKQHPNDLKNLLNELKHPKLIHLMRNPFESATSLLKSHSHQVHDIEQAFNFIIKKHLETQEMCIELDLPRLVITYEDLVNSPSESLKNVFEFLELSTSPKIIDALIASISNKNADSNVPEKYRQKLIHHSDLFSYYL